MTIEEKLDLILNEVKEHFGHHPDKKAWTRISMLVTDGDGVTSGNPDFEGDPFLTMLLNNLEKEGFIQKFENKAIGKTYYISTVKGLLFEGFVKQKVDREREKDRQKFEKELERQLAEAKNVLDTKMKGLQSRMVILTWLIAVGTLVAAVYYGIEIYKFFSSPPESCF